MYFTLYLTSNQVKDLEFEVISKDLKIYITRYLYRICENQRSQEINIIKKNKLINLARTLASGKIYVLTPDQDGYYEYYDYAWHDGHFFLAFRELSNIQFIEFLCHIVEEEFINVNEINTLLSKDKQSFKLIENSDELKVKVYSLTQIDNSPNEDEHPNIRVLVLRMDRAYDAGDFSEVLHSSATIFETLAKDIIGTENVANEPLGGFFERYRKDSSLPSEILDHILNIYKERNVTHLAGHGGLTPPNITDKESLTLLEMTKAFVRIEYKFQNITIEHK